MRLFILKNGKSNFNNRELIFTNKGEVRNIHNQNLNK